MGTNFSVEPGKLKSAASQIKTEANIIQSKYTAIYSCIDALIQRGWDSDDGRKFQADMKKFEQDFANLKKALDNSADAITASADAYIKGQQA